MKIGNFEINIGRVQNAKPAEHAGQVLTKLIRTQLIRSRSEIKDWTTATNMSESLLNPNRMELIRIYNNVVIDSHLSSVMNTLKLKILGASWKVFNGDVVDEQATARLNSDWFRKILESFVDSEFYGFTLVQLGDITNDRFAIDFVPREYVIPERRVVKKTLTDIKSVISIDEQPFADWLIFADSGTLGLLHKASPLAIMKRAVLSSWSEYAEIFGLPIRIGRTDIRDPRKYKNMDDMLAKMGSASYGVFDPQDNIEFIETSKGDAFQVFNEFINRADQQISKLILGQTGTTDEKAFTGSANVHAGVLDDIVASYVQKMTFFVNGVVFPKLLIHGFVDAKHTFGIQTEIRLANDEKIKAVEMLLKNYDIDPDWIEKNIGVPVTTKVVPVVVPPVNNPNPQPVNESVMKVVSKLYADILHDCESHEH